ncbi:hypothetical protein RM697_08325 [Ichthyenterobacterium sp. W332]|uniref:Uncharacterized protein n=1 Tax=Microcosmobacter mediterraneus TaxID=3075607 RepID=A0ABU2YKG2_9FLAO|nr:hypothetical protein [Ichthyenterobacterium sp. W332]MDT0558649.1 hypothetical protein [Ichthyenterobacterium sp. W332]
MKAASISELKKELKFKSKEELLDYCMAMARFKLESKELLTYLAFESEDEAAYIESVKNYISAEFETINTVSYHYIKKSIRKILRQVKRYIRYSKKPATEAEVLIYFCKTLSEMKPSYKRNKVLVNSYDTQLRMANKAIAKLHEDLQYDFQLLIDEL